MHTAGECEIFRASERDTGCGYTLYGGVVCKVGKEHRPFNRAGAFEIVHEILRFFKGYAYCGENYREIGIRTAHLCLSCNLCGELGVGQAAHREHGELLPSYKRIESVYCGYASLNEFVGIVARGGVDGFAVNIQLLFGNNRVAAVAGVAHAVEYSAQHIAGNGKLLAMTRKARFCRGYLKPLRIFKELNDRFVAVDFQHLAPSRFSVCTDDVYEFVIFYALYALHEHKRADYFLYGLVFLKHLPHLPARAPLSPRS